MFTYLCKFLLLRSFLLVFPVREVMMVIMIVVIVVIVVVVVAVMVGVVMMVVVALVVLVMIVAVVVMMVMVVADLVRPYTASCTRADAMDDTASSCGPLKMLGSFRVTNHRGYGR